MSTLRHQPWGYRYVTLDYNEAQFTDNTMSVDPVYLKEANLPYHDLLALA